MFSINMLEMQPGWGETQFYVTYSAKYWSKEGLTKFLPESVPEYTSSNLPLVSQQAMLVVFPNPKIKG